MRTSGLGMALFLLGWIVPLIAAAPQHAPVAREATETDARKLQEQLGQGKKILVIDVRSEKEYAAGHIPGAVNIPIEELSKKIAAMKVAKDTVIVTVCEHGGRSSRAVLELQKLGYKATSFCRLDSWKKEGNPIEKSGEKPPSTSKLYRFYCQHSCLTYVETADLEQVCEHCDCAKAYRQCMKGA